MIFEQEIFFFIKKLVWISWPLPNPTPGCYAVTWRFYDADFSKFNYIEIITPDCNYIAELRKKITIFAQFKRTILVVLSPQDDFSITLFSSSSKIRTREKMRNMTCTTRLPQIVTLCAFNSFHLHANRLVATALFFDTIKFML